MVIVPEAPKVKEASEFVGGRVETTNTLRKSIVKINKNSMYGKFSVVSNTLEKVIANIQEHDRLHPEHGVGCACHDVHAGMIRRLYEGIDEKSKRNLMVVLGYVTRSP